MANPESGSAVSGTAVAEGGATLGHPPPPGPTGMLTFDDLKRITGYRRRADVERTLQQQGIRLFRGRAGPWTTVDLVNQAGGIGQVSKEQYGVDIL
ncbi:hypothetical protein SAMN05216602_1486 [Pseudomonas argentinensis]|uniref:DUF4224 domain-containing protein n=2 Tax=Phytopseudomonas argentinensis TaxID=289370 RepID=A0A1I3I7W8_9GAMM|nr:hypothetical protein SAMN05216602_1486 [Pseudomonas argentinensis]